MPDINPSSLECFYFFLLMLGVFYAVLVMIAGGLHSIHLPIHVDFGHLPVHVPGLADVHVGDVGRADRTRRLTIVAPDPPAGGTA